MRRLAGALVGMILTYLAGPLEAIFGGGVWRIVGLVVWGLVTEHRQP